MSWLMELKHSLRALARNPALTVAALLTLALGTGANAAIFSVVRGVLLAPLPYPEPDRIVRVWPGTEVNTEFLEHARRSARSLSAVTAYLPDAFSLTGGDRPVELPGARVTAQFFDVTGVKPSLGRAFTPEESGPGRGAVVILGHGLWQQTFDGDPEVVGRSVVIGGREHIVIGVMPAAYVPLDPRWRLWVPVEIDPGNEHHWDWLGYRMVGRLAPGSDLAAARNDLHAAIADYARIRPDYLPDADRVAAVTPLHEQMVGSVRRTIALLQGAVALVLLVSCANVANLMLARVTARRRELALRGALGADTSRLVSQVLGESLLLSLLGGVLGLLVAEWALALLVGQLPGTVPRATDIEIDLGVVAFTLGLSVAAGLLFGLLPALRASRTAPAAALAAGGRSGAPASHHGLNHLLVAAEIALSVVLVIGAGLLLKSFRTLQEVDIGFDSRQLLTLRLAPPEGRYPDEPTRRRYFEQVVERVGAVPGVRSAAAISRLPMTPGDVGLGFRLPDRELPASSRSASVRMITPNLFGTLGVPLLRGRALADGDHADAPPVGLVNAALAERLWGEDDPIGRQLVFDNDEVWFTVVGVVGDIRQHRLDLDARPQVYRPLAQSTWEPRVALVLRGDGVRSMLPQIERAIWSVDPHVPISQVAMMEEVIRRTLRDPRLVTSLFSLFAGLAVVLGVIGVFGMTWYTVSQRTHEHGVRLVLGATSGDIVQLTLRRTLIPVVIGLAAGALASTWVMGLLEGLLFEVRPTDPVVFVAVVLVLAGCAALAAWLPARRATRVEPMHALGTD